MRWRDGRDWQTMVEWATKLHDGIYASQSPMPVAKLCGCTEPEAICVKLAVATEYPYGWACTKPAYIPPLQGATDCDRRIYDWREGNTAQSAKKGCKMPTLRCGTTDEILTWTEDTLRYLTANAGNPGVRIAAEMLLEDLDEHPPVSVKVLEDLGNMMLDRLHLDKPWKGEA